MASTTLREVTGARAYRPVRGLEAKPPVGSIKGQSPWSGSDMSIWGQNSKGDDKFANFTVIQRQRKEGIKAKFLNHIAITN